MRERWRRVDLLLDQALEIPEAERRAFLESADVDIGIRAEVAALLAIEQEADRWLDGSGELASGEPVAPGASFGTYRLRRRLGRGGMGSVFLAEQAQDGVERRVAIKVLDGRDPHPELVARLRREGRILARLEHPNIARLYETGTTDDGLPFLVMEYVEGQTLDAYCDAKRLTIDARVDLFIKVCEAVQFAHQRLLVHRDLKPENILVSRNGEPKLLDFGIAKPLAPLAGDPTRLTRTHSRPMTPRYASPEQTRGEPITTASDVYALGVLLYEMLSGRMPYRLDGRSPAEVERLICTHVPMPVSRAVRLTSVGEESADVLGQRRGGSALRISRQLAGDLDTIVAMALRKEPERRYPSAERLAEDLRRHRRRLPVTARSSTLGYRLGRFVQRHRWGTAVALLTAMLIIGWTATSRRDAERVAHQRDRAEMLVASLIDLFQVADPSRRQGETVSALEILEQGERLIREMLTDDPEVQARLLHSIGRVYLNRDQLASAEPVFQEAMSLRRSVLGDQHPVMGEALLDLALLARKQNEFGRAESLARQAVARMEQDSAAHHVALAEALDLLVDLLAERAALEEAIVQGNQALAIRRQFGDAADGGFSTSLALLAKAYELNGDFAEAERLARTATEHALVALGEDHPKTIQITQRLIGALYKAKKLDEAESWVRRTLAAQERVYGAGHRRLAEGNNLLGVILAHQGRLAEAEAVERRALEIAVEWLGPDHGEITYYLSNLGKTLTQLGRPATAEPLFRRAVAIARASFPPGAPHVSNPLVGLAMALVDTGRAAEAEPLLREALALRREAFPDGKASQVARAEVELGNCLVALSRHDEARTLLESGLPVLEAIEGEESYPARRGRRAAEVVGNYFSRR